MLLLYCIPAAQSTLNNVGAWAFQLQNFNTNALATGTGYNLVVTDYSYDGSNANRVPAADVTTVKNSDKLYVSYISIGEAEDYRSYWQTGWAGNPPAWLGPENPNWQGNYKVRYWDTAWQNIVYSYVDTIIAQDFDGIYLDIIDAWYYWQHEVPQQQQVSNADSLMIDFILRIRNHVYTVTGNQQFLIIPQNGEDLIYQPAISTGLRNQYLNAINAVGIEDVFFTGNNDEDNPYAPDYYRINNLLQYKAAGKKILTIEYLTQPAKIQQYRDSADTYGFVTYACTRPLNQLCAALPTGINDAEQTTVKVFPNPVTGSTIQLQTQDNIQASKIYLADITGKKTILQATANGDKITATIPFGLTNGFYLLTLQFANYSHTQSIILNR